MEVIGIDISKQTFDVWGGDLGHRKFQNNPVGFKEFVTHLSQQHCIMEATGCYHLQLAIFLYEEGICVSVVNPLQIKRFRQMKLHRLKTDKADAPIIAQYGVEQKPDLWKPESKEINESKLMLSLVELYIRQQTSLKNKLNNLKSGGMKSGKMITSLNLQLKRIKLEIEKLETELLTIIKTLSPEKLMQLTSIPGIGTKTAMIMLIVSNNFEAFENYRQFIAYIGLAPVERQSGSSIRGRSYISKKGNKLLRNHLFMCSFTACQHNPQCKALFNRIINKGKSKKLALIAVCNKLIKQSFGVVSNDLIYDPQYKPTLIVK